MRASVRLGFLPIALTAATCVLAVVNVALTNTAVSEAQISALIPNPPTPAVPVTNVVAFGVLDNASPIGGGDCEGHVQSAAYALGEGLFLYAYQLECHCGPNWDVGYAAAGGGLRVPLNNNEAFPADFNNDGNAIETSFHTTNVGFRPFTSDLVAMNDGDDFGNSPSDFTISAIQSDTHIEFFNADGIFLTGDVAGFVTDSPPMVANGAHLGGSNTSFNLVVPSPGVPGIRITLVPSPPNNRYVIDAVPTMPLVRARAKVVHVTPDPTPNTTFTWTAKLRVNRKAPPGSGCAGTCQNAAEVSFDSDIQQNATTLGDAIYTLMFKDPAVFRGGKLELKAEATVNSQMLSGKTPTGLRIEGTNPARTAIQNSVDVQVPVDGFFELQTADIQDVLKRIACQESCVGQKQFLAGANGGVGPTLISCDNGIGIFQITNVTSCRDPFTGCRGVLFNWRDNVAGGVRAYQDKVRAAHGYPARLRGREAYREFIRNVINPQRLLAGLRPIPAFPAPQFTTAGLIGSDPPNQLLEDGVRGYNGFPPAGPFGLEWHEFTPDTNFLLTVPDDQLGALNQDRRVWRRVLPAERPQVGDPNYVNNVQSRPPQCGG